MWFIVATGISFAVIILIAAIFDWQTRRSGRRPGSARDISAKVRAAHRETWRTRLKGTKFEQLFGDQTPQPRPGDPRYGTKSQGVYTVKKERPPHER